MLKHLPRKKILLAMGDALLISIAYFASPYLRFGLFIEEYIQPTLLGTLVFTFIYIFTFYMTDLYDFDIPFSSARYLFRYFIGFSVATTAVVIAFYFLPSLKTGRVVFAMTAAKIVVFTYAWRIGLEWAFRSFFERPRKILIVGAGRAGMTIYRLIKDNKGFDVVGFIDDERTSGVVNSPEILGDFTVLDEMVTHHKVDSIVITITHPRDPELLKCVLHSKMEGVQVYDMPGFYEEVTGKVPVEFLSDLWFVNTPILGVKRSFYNHRVKRMLDITCSLMCIIATLPVMVIIAAAIKLESRGPVFYRQKREGLYGKTFDLVKFRSMRQDAEKEGAVWAVENDPRVTRVGRIIRKLRLDEIPQVWNVLKGEMSFIGPRPERPEFIKRLKTKIPYYSLRDSVKPGITGWAQVNYPYGSSEKDALEKLKYDFYYIKNVTPVLDFHILVRTIKVAIFGKGSR